MVAFELLLCLLYWNKIKKKTRILYRKYTTLLYVAVNLKRVKLPTEKWAGNIWSAWVIHIPLVIIYRAIYYAGVRMNHVWGGHYYEQPKWPPKRYYTYRKLIMCNSNVINIGQIVFTTGHDSENQTLTY